ncbi:MAG: bifunctional (p)ppGpp synthetase/guanosine-3',5'-bis(diphosphate) 3'-pyrophosphohydrolase [Oscillospiraceae bacterium]|nr:bifunctional (p)ppGpp synthetase/guanosine-3',5'-bis(diphosphate) 3'-pyrophosphohydrolase [Oscillospiraceae bacterium]
MVKGYSPNANTDMIYIAYRLAKSAHIHQFRRSDAPYIEHPVQIAFIAAQLSLDATAISAALLHDVVEDTPYTYDDIKSLFGESVAELVDGVTKLKQIKYNSREEQQVENLRKMFFAMSKDIRVIIIKLIDRLHNMRTLNFMPPKKQLLISKETLDVYAPLAHRLGMSKIKIELEDLALKYLDPVAYEEITQSINQKKSERELYIKEIIEVLREKLVVMNIKGEVTGRAKHFYSIFRKMYTQNKTLDELYDLFAVRVIVDTVADCYAVLGMVHDLYTPVPMRFKDYIAMPKPNMYQSLHTTVIDHNGTPFEIQIRTWEMHKVAEEGIAAHWKYKEGITGKTDMDGKLEWVRQLLDTQSNIIDTDDFFNTLRFDLFSDEVFVFTPQGKVISLPAGSTVIDFAFSIHSQVGYKMSGAKVNGKIVPNSYVIKNGEIVEILTANTHGPSRDWLKICKTSQAKNKINQWFKRERRDENIEHGKELIERELRRLGNTHAQLFRPEWTESMTKRYGFQSLDDLYASVGYGGLTVQKVVVRLRDQWLQEQKALEKQKKLELVYDAESNTVQTEPSKRHTSNKGIVVKNIDNCLVRLAGCCNPVAGDDIVGFITKGRGVSVHRRDCPNMNPDSMSEEDRHRFIEVWWDAERSTSYIANLQIEAHDRDGVLLEVTNILANLKIPFKSVNAYVTKKGMAIIQIGVEIRNTSDLALLTKKIKQIHGVTAVTRNSN